MISFRYYKYIMKKYLFFTLFGLYTALAQNPTRDITFGGDGTVRTGMGPNNDNISAIAIQPDGKILASGTQTNDAIYGPR